MQAQILNNTSLVQLLQHQEQLYSSAMSLAAKFKASSHQESEKLSQYTDELNQIMSEVMSTDQAIAQMRGQLEVTGQLKSPDVRQLVARQEQKLRTLISEIDASLGHVSQQHSELAESLDSGADRSSMQEAYRTSMRTG